VTRTPVRSEGLGYERGEKKRGLERHVYALTNLAVAPKEKKREGIRGTPGENEKKKKDSALVRNFLGPGLFVGGVRPVGKKGAGKPIFRGKKGWGDEKGGRSTTWGTGENGQVTGTKVAKRQKQGKAGWRLLSGVSVRKEAPGKTTVWGGGRGRGSRMPTARQSEQNVPVKGGLGG